jgi:hypothetical protein
MDNAAIDYMGFMKLMPIHWYELINELFGSLT